MQVTESTSNEVADRPLLLLDDDVAPDVGSILDGEESDADDSIDELDILFDFDHEQVVSDMAAVKATIAKVGLYFGNCICHSI